MSSPSLSRALAWRPDALRLVADRWDEAIPPGRIIPVVDRVSGIFSADAVQIRRRSERPVSILCGPSQCMEFGLLHLLVDVMPDDFVNLVQVTYQFLIPERTTMTSPTFQTSWNPKPQEITYRLGKQGTTVVPFVSVTPSR